MMHFIINSVLVLCYILVVNFSSLDVDEIKVTISD